LPPSFRFPPLREGNHTGVRFPLLAADKGASLEFAAYGVGAFCVALTPRPSPTLWERGVGAHGGAPLRFPLACVRERGTQGVRAKEGKTQNAPRRIEAQIADFTEVGGVELHTPATDCRA